MSKLTKAYLCKYFANKYIPHDEWKITIDGVAHIVSNKHVINSILKSSPQEQKIFANALLELESSNTDINIFLKYLAFESNILSHNTSIGLQTSSNYNNKSA